MNTALIKKESESKIPTDLSKAFVAHPKAKIKWKDLTPLARRDFITWIEGAKQPETRARRIAKTCSVLPAGKRRPCCYSIMPPNFYKFLGASPKAKAQWSDLNPTDRRDLVDWIESATEPKMRNNRMEKACLMLAAGKRRF
jgi:uncharacterized protein YdeI (YjbR/CyaY-like superfamily)